MGAMKPDDTAKQASHEIAEVEQIVDQVRLMSPEVAKAFVKMQAAMPAAIRADTGGQIGSNRYKYLNLAGLLEACRPKLGDHGFALIQTPTAPQDPAAVAINTKLLHESGAFYDAGTLEVPYGDRGSGAQRAGSALTYARRYALLMLFGCSASEDDDDGAVGGEPRRQAATQGSSRGPTPPSRSRPPASPPNPGPQPKQKQDPPRTRDRFLNAEERERLANACRDRAEELEGIVDPRAIAEAMAAHFNFEGVRALRTDPKGDAVTGFLAFIAHYDPAPEPPAEDPPPPAEGDEPPPPQGDEIPF